VSHELTPQEFQRAVKRLLVLATTADEEIEPDEVQMLETVYRNVTGAEMDESDLFDELSELQSHPVRVDVFVRALAGRMTWDQKQTLLKAVLLVSGADHGLQDDERLLIENIASALAEDAAELDRLLSAAEYDSQSS
jgi:uncharacterized tellurite resistance protein B-like protein